MFWLLLSPLLAFLSTVLAEQAPRQIAWTDDTFGPDGPWRALNIEMGPDNDGVAMYPGSVWESWVIEDKYCESEACYATKAGTYNKSSGSTGGIAIGGGLDNYMLGLNLEGGQGTRYMDDISLALSGGSSTIRVKNSSLVLLERQQRIKYPGGQSFQFSVGCLSMGGSGAVNQTFEQENKLPVNASLPPGWLLENKWTPSNSFGMHIGSVQPAMSGSMWFGGYDQNRVIGEILNTNGNPRDGITLWDIGIEVIDGRSPFDFKSKEGILASGNSSIVNGLKVAIDGCSPYLTLPKSTCDSIAANLPVNFDDNLGLYLWDTKSKDYKSIVSSATALTFSFISDSNTDLVKIRVPFMHLNLTLESPLVSTPTPYFPCHANGKGVYVLGRAFLQDAFIGANWHKDINTWWMAQAPGRSIQATTNVVPIGEKDKIINKGGNDWKASWKGVWDPEAVPSNTSSDDKDNGSSKEKPPPSQEEIPPTSPPPDVSGTSEGKGGLSRGAIAGIGAGAGVAVLLLGIGAFFFWRHRRGQAMKSHSDQSAPTESLPHKPYSTYDPTFNPNHLPPQEMPAKGISSSPYSRYELPSA